MQRSGRREWLLRLILLGGSLLFALAIAEVAVRAFFPINDGRSNMKLDGQPITDWFEPGSVYRQISNEYDALTTITDKGHRVPGSEGNPEVIFLGDSFTYGYGLNDDETIAAIYCRTLGTACANLGLPGSGTERQLARLRQFVEAYHWKPREVKLFFFGMSGSFSAGNDFVDNYNYGRRADALARGQRPQRDASPPSLAGRIISWQSALMEYSHLVRRAKFYWGPLLKSMIVNDPGEQRIAQALEFTARALNEFDEYSRQVGFEYKVYLLMPVQDLIRRTDGDTLAALSRVSPKPVISVAPALVDSPASYYYAFDGHLNPAGSRRVAEFVIAQDKK